MQDFFSIIGTGCELPASAIQDLKEFGFVIIPGPVPPDSLAGLAASYDSAVALASSDDLGVGSTTTRVHDLVNRGSAFDELYLSTHPRGVLANHRATIQTQYDAREDCTTALAGIGSPRGLRAR